MKVHFIVTFLFVFRILSVSAERPQPAAFDSLLNDKCLQSAEVGICVYDLTADSLLYTYQAEKLARPASNMKLVTCISALSLLGTDYPLKTSLYYSGDREKKKIKGDLYVTGGFDPEFRVEDIPILLGVLQGEELERVHGDVYADLSFKDTIPYGAGWCWDDASEDYQLRMSPLFLRGTLPLSKPEDRFMELFCLALDNIGFSYSTYKGCITQRPADAILLGSVQRRLQDVTRRALKNSNNLNAEAIFYQLAAWQRNGVGATAKDAIQAEQKLLLDLGIPSDQYRLADGCGLSPYNLVSPMLLVKLLHHAYQNLTIFPVLYDQLPISGMDGTLKNRMKTGPAYQNIHAKTGTLTGISSLSGYAKAANGHMLAFSILCQNILDGKAVHAWQDVFCEMLCK